MAIFHFTAKVVSRREGQNAVAAAAYRSGERLRIEATGAIKHYRRRAERIVFAGIFAPPTAPAWVLNRNRLWNEVERIERRSDATLARELELALPHELTAQQRLWLVKDFVREAFTRRGFVVDVAIHAPDGDSDGRNHHVHLLIVERRIGPRGFAAHKDRSLSRKQTLRGWRAQWARLVNRHLERHGHAVRVDHRSLKAQGIRREPTTHLGPVAVEMQRRGAVSRRSQHLQGITTRNALRAEWQVSGSAVCPPTRGTVPIAARVAFLQSPMSQPITLEARPGNSAVIQTAFVGGAKTRLLVAGGSDRTSSIMAKSTAAAPAVTEGCLPFEPEGGEAEYAAIRAMFGARMDEVCRRLPPDQARAAMQMLKQEQLAMIAGLREQQKRKRDGRRQLARHYHPVVPATAQAS